MGQSHSGPSGSQPQSEVESLAASLGFLPMLDRAFDALSEDSTKTIHATSLQQCFSIRCGKPSAGAAGWPGLAASLEGLLYHVGPSVVDAFFVLEKDGFSKQGFIGGFVACCGRMNASIKLGNFLRVFALAGKKAGISLDLNFEDVDGDWKATGNLRPADVVLLLYACWSMLWSAMRRELSVKEAMFLPDIRNLVLSAVVSCCEVPGSLDLWNCDVIDLEVVLPVGKFLSWVLASVPSLPDCFSQFIHQCVLIIINSAVVEDTTEPLDSSSITGPDAHLLTPGMAWAIFLSRGMTSTVEALLRHCFIKQRDETTGNLLYRSSRHGKGLNRFWSNVEGYNGPMLILISGSSEDSDSRKNKWIIGALIQHGFENRNHFYGSSATLYALEPVFQAFSPSGKEKNFMYSHLHPTARMYEPKPKPVGIAFGGTLGNERVFLDEDFSRITIRHHAGDKTYQPGPLIPNQGFLAVDGSILEVEAWGLGGSSSKESQTSYKKREQLFTEQRRRVDLKTFANWEDSPENMMMGMLSDPNRVQREDR
ncbi:hypothetical protein MLD38_034383 [Melastoma candidum]|uniref:Uncharacterized protein n=1 Tax=Melastoma candidum TaxID=119954 RepID=A0ACB9M9R9_9MYRT|nr:hypothetical protein MLD38_034383 [Melastoma candidum]